MIRALPPRHDVSGRVVEAFLAAPDRTLWVRDLRALGNPSSIYHAVAMLEGRGWLEQVDATRGRGGTWRRLRLTDAGADLARTEQQLRTDE